VNWNWLGAVFVQAPATVQVINGSDRLVVDSTVKHASGVLLKENWQTPLPSICTPARIGGVPITPCVTGMVWPSRVMLAGAGRARIRVAIENHIRAACAALIPHGEVQPCGIRRGCPGACRGRNREHHTNGPRRRTNQKRSCAESTNRGLRRRGAPGHPPQRSEQAPAIAQCGSAMEGESAPDGAEDRLHWIR
jgi:hypothetical protein